MTHPLKTNGPRTAATDLRSAGSSSTSYFVVSAGPSPSPLEAKSSILEMNDTRGQKKIEVNVK